MDREGMSSLFRRLRAEAAAPRKLGEGLREAGARLDRLVAEPRALAELADAGLGPLAEPVAVPPALEARLWRCLGGGGETERAAARQVRKGPSRSTAHPEAPLGRPTLLGPGGGARSGAGGGEGHRRGTSAPATGFAGGEKGRAAPCETHATPVGTPSDGRAGAVGSGPRRSTDQVGRRARAAERPAPLPGEATGADRPVLVGGASPAVAEMLARYGEATGSSAAGGARDDGGPRPGGPVSRSGPARGQAAEEERGRGPGGQRGPAGPTGGDAARRRTEAPGPVRVGDAPTRFAAPPRNGSRFAAPAARRSLGSPPDDPGRPGAPAAAQRLGEDAPPPRAVTPVGASGPTGLRALAALRDGPLEDVRPEGRAGAPSPLETPSDRDLPPLLRERAREKELVHVLGRALRAEAARHGIEVDRS